jgi:hypothetical protein
MEMQAKLSFARYCIASMQKHWDKFLSVLHTHEYLS